MTSTKLTRSMKPTHQSGNTYQNSLTHFTLTHYSTAAIRWSLVSVLSLVRQCCPPRNTIGRQPCVGKARCQIFCESITWPFFLPLFYSMTTEIVRLLASELKWRSDKSAAIFYPCWCLLRHTQARTGIFTSQRDNRTLWHASAWPTFLLEDESPSCGSLV